MSQLGVENISQPSDAVKEGQALDLKVLEVDPIHHRIVLAVVGYPDVPGIEIPKLEVPVDEAGAPVDEAGAPADEGVAPADEGVARADEGVAPAEVPPAE
jgi:hypothetical protein